MNTSTQRKLGRRCASFLQKKHHSHFIDGSYVHSDATQRIDVLNPATEEYIGDVPLGNGTDVQKAVAAAKKAFQHNADWRRMQTSEREKIIFTIAEKIEEHAESLAELVTLENGKLIRDARKSDINGAANTFRYYAGWSTKIEGETLDIAQPQKAGRQNFAFTRREPVGIVAAIIPWNFPLSIAAWKIAPALAAGCTIVLKPSEETPLSALLLAELATEAGLPPGVLNVITGDGLTTGKKLVEHPDVGKITFTGSTSTGKAIGTSAMESVKELSLELGGKSPAIVFDDTEDIERTAKGIADGIFRNQGQVCVAGSRVYIQKKIFDRLLGDICRLAENMIISDGFDEKADLGPLISGRQRERVCDYIRTGLKEGAELITGGKKLDRKGFFLKPSIFSLTENKATIVQEEIFGPVLTAIPFGTLEDALQKANDNNMGLAATVWTSDISKALTMVNRLEAGIIYVNSPVRSDPNLPLGGYKTSGIGRELGKVGVYNYTTLKSINIVY